MDPPGKVLVKSARPVLAAIRGRRHFPTTIAAIEAVTQQLLATGNPLSATDLLQLARLADIHDTLTECEIVRGLAIDDGDRDGWQAAARLAATFCAAQRGVLRDLRLSRAGTTAATPSRERKADERSGRGANVVTGKFGVI